MIKSITAPILPVALEKLKEIISSDKNKGKTIIFCEDRLTLAAERAVCAALGGTFDVSVYTLARFLSSEMGKRANILSSQGSAMAIRRIIEQNKSSLKLFGKFSAAASAGAVYDTIALLYAAKIKADDLKKANAKGLLESKLSDISLIYSLYEEYLEKSGKTDRNKYLGELPHVIAKSEKIKGSNVIFLGFQSFTRSSAECVAETIKRAENVTGLFIGGSEAIYTNEGAAKFEHIAEMEKRADDKLVREFVKSNLNADAELLRKSLFNPDSYSDIHTYTENVCICEATDEEEEMEFIAASIKKYVLDGVEVKADGKAVKQIRYGNISVMLPDVGAAEHRIERIFSEYRIPYYADRRRPLSEHPVCEFILSYLACVRSGCNLTDVDAVVSSPLFPAERKDKDSFRNYALRLADYRGGINREPKKEILDNFAFDYDGVQAVRQLFFDGKKLLPAKLLAVESDGAEKKRAKKQLCVCPPDITRGIKKLFENFKVEEKLQSLKEKFKDSYPTASEFCGRVSEAALAVVDEAENILGWEYMPLNEYIQILKSGFIAAEISLIPPKADAVFIGDIAATANTGSEIVFIPSLTEGVPKTSSDTSLLTDNEIESLENADLEISPKIRQVNMRRREQTALNICAFKEKLYLIYPVRSGSEESGASEIIDYASEVFGDKGENGEIVKKGILPIRKKNIEMMAYYCSEKVPALKKLKAEIPSQNARAIYMALKDYGYKAEADGIAIASDSKKISCGRELFVNFDSVSPTSLETYYSCPYKSFMQQGLKLQEREEGTMRPLDTGNFIHAVLQKLAPEMDGFKSVQEAKERAYDEANSLLKSKAYSSLTDSKSGQYTADELIKEAGEVTAGAYEQLANSRFKVERAEQRCEIELDDNVRIGGRIDRVDVCDDMIRIIDYKTGAVEADATKYYMGLKLQLPLYLTAAAKNRRAVGAYYFPASVTYRTKPDGVFRLQGFMDGSEEVVSASDTTIQDKQKSAYIEASVSGKKSESAMENGIFADFLQYSTLIARRGVKEMLQGNIEPSPADGACKYCKMGGSCNFAAGRDGEERTSRTVKCAEIAHVVRKERGDE